MAWGEPKRKLYRISKAILMKGSEVTLQGSCLHSVRSKAAEEMGLETETEDCGSIPHPRV